MSSVSQTGQYKRRQPSATFVDIGFCLVRKGSNMKLSIPTALVLVCLLQTAFCQLAAITGTQLGYLLLGTGLGAAFGGRRGPAFPPPPPPFLPPPFIAPFPPPPFFFRPPPMHFYG